MFVYARVHNELGFPPSGRPDINQVIRSLGQRCRRPFGCPPTDSLNAERNYYCLRSCHVCVACEPI